TTKELEKGTGILGNLDGKIYIQLKSDPINLKSAKLYYDVGADPDGSAPDGTTDKNRAVALKKVEGEDNLWVATIPIIDPEIDLGEEVRFIVTVDGYTYDNDNSGAPWTYQIRDYAIQEASPYTTVLNNAFDPNEARDDLSKAFHLIYKLSRKSWVNVSIYSVRGDLVRQLINEEKEIGRHDVAWDGYNDAGKMVAMGLYLVNIETAEYGDIRKIIVIIR
ncbi:MAG: hypothetical protein L0Y62_02630, partial [Nitrospirae bacterium]|nr:hypothetical protein [Nitrospirota bacterium]